MIKNNVNQLKSKYAQIFNSKIIYLQLIFFIFSTINLFICKNFLEEKFPVANLTRNMTLAKKKPNEKIILMIFAGRREYIEIGMNYLLLLLEKGKIDEIHFWLFTKNKFNIYYINSISNLHKTSKYLDDYLEIHPKIIENKVELSLRKCIYSNK